MGIYWARRGGLAKQRVKVDPMRSRPDFPSCANADPDLKSLAITFFRENFWNEICGDALPLPMAVAVFDQAVNFGPKPAAKEMQAVLGVIVDGEVGPNTIRAAKAKGFEAVIRLLAQRNLRYLDDVRKYPEDARWLPGWMDRVIRLAVEVTKIDVERRGGTVI
jgi:lysozyme family protein